MIRKFFLLVFLLSLPASAQVASSTNFTLEKSVVSSGGSSSASASFSISGTSGQPAAGPSISTSYSLIGGFWEYEFSPTAAPAEINGRVTDDRDKGISGALVRAVSPTGETKIAVTNLFGLYRITGLPAGQGYVVSVAAKRYVFPNGPRFVSLQADVAGLDFRAAPRN